MRGPIVYVSGYKGEREAVPERDAIPCHKSDCSNYVARGGKSRYQCSDCGRPACYPPACTGGDCPVAERRFEREQVMERNRDRARRRAERDAKRAK